MTFAIVLSGFVIAGVCAGIRLLQGPFTATVAASKFVESKPPADGEED